MDFWQKSDRVGRILWLVAVITSTLSVFMIWGHVDLKYWAPLFFIGFFTGGMWNIRYAAQNFR